MKLTLTLPARARLPRRVAAERSGPTRLFTVSLAAIAVALVFGAGPLASWADALPDCPGVSMVSEATQEWHDMMHRVGLDAPYEAIRSAVRAAEAAQPR